MTDTVWPALGTALAAIAPFLILLALAAGAIGAAYLAVWTAAIEARLDAIERRMRH